MNAREVGDMNRRIAERWAAVNNYPELPVRGPSWAHSIHDAGDELIGIHDVTGAPYPIDLHRDLDPENRAIIVARRIFQAGGSVDEVRRFLLSFDLPTYVLRRLSNELAEAGHR
jgi:hypothetical protein